MQRLRVLVPELKKGARERPEQMMLRGPNDKAVARVEFHSECSINRTPLLVVLQRLGHHLDDGAPRPRGHRKCLGAVQLVQDGFDQSRESIHRQGNCAMTRVASSEANALPVGHAFEGAAQQGGTIRLKQDLLCPELCQGLGGVDEFNVHGKARSEGGRSVQD